MSKSKSYPAFTALTEYVGVDTLIVHMLLDVDSNDGASPLLQKKGVRRTREDMPLEWARGHFEPDDKQTIHYELSNAGRDLRLTLHPSKIMDNKHSTLCHGDLVHGTVAWTIQQLYPLCRPIWTLNKETGELLDDPRSWPSTWTDQVDVSILHCARDIYDDKYGFSPGQLIHVQKKNYPDDNLYRNNGKINTLNYGNSKRIRTNFYNKSDAPNHDVPEGWNRFEIQMGRQFLIENGVSTLSDITHEKVESLLWARWEDGRLGTPYSVESALAEFFKEVATQESGSTAITLLGLATALEHGLDVPMNARTITHYKKIGRKYGFNLGETIASMGTSLVAVDFASGRVIEVDSPNAA
jgi:hypothetical protein